MTISGVVVDDFNAFQCHLSVFHLISWNGASFIIITVVIIYEYSDWLAHTSNIHCTSFVEITESLGNISS